MTETPDPKATAYLAGLDGALQSLPPTQRTELLREIGSHLAERSDQGRLDEALAALGAPHDFARPFVEDLDLSNALNRSSPLPLLLSILRRSVRNVLAFVTGFVAVTFYVLAFGFALVAVLKPITPNNVGYWPSEHEFGAIYGTIHTQPEALGYWIVPICGLAAMISYVIATAILRFTAGVLLRRAPSPAFA